MEVYQYAQLSHIENHCDRDSKPTRTRILMLLFKTKVFNNKKANESRKLPATPSPAFMYNAHSSKILHALLKLYDIYCILLYYYYYIILLCDITDTY